MSLARQILRPLAHVAGIHATSQLRAFLAAHTDTLTVQQRLLNELVTHFAPTDFGHDHGLDQVRTYEDFTKAVPIAGYEGFEPYIRRVLEGQTAALLPPGDELLMFSRTSGTTASPKHIPVTARVADEMRRGWNIFGMKMFRDHRRAWLRPILQISSPMRECDSPRGKPCGAISGLLAQTQKKIVRRMYVVPPSVPSIREPEARFYVTLRCAIGHDVSMITTASPSSTIKLIETGQRHGEHLLRDIADGTCTAPGAIEPQIAAGLRFRPNRPLARRLEAGIARDGVLLPRHFWNVEVLNNWTGGTLQLYLPRLRELFHGVAIRDIGLLASEGRFTIPIADGTPGGLAEISGNFLEFIPAGEYGRPDARALRAHELDIGQKYYLVLSNFTGLLRYSIDDCVRVADRYGQSPVLEFLHRGTHTANIAGEKITEHQVVAAMSQAARRSGVKIERFVLQGRFAAMPYYELRLEVPDGGAGSLPDSAGTGIPPAQSLPAAIAALMDKALGELNIEYHSKRTSNRLGPIQPRVVETGTFEDAERRQIAGRNGRSEQYKHQYLLTDVIADDKTT